MLISVFISNQNVSAISAQFSKVGDSIWYYRTVTVYSATATTFIKVYLWFSFRIQQL